MSRLCLVALCLYAAGFVLLVIWQREIVFYPTYRAQALGPMLSPKDYGLTNFTETTLTTGDHVKLVAWLHPAKPGMQTVLFLHGKSVNISARASRLQALADAGYGVMALSWRGYGRSEGTPYEKGLNEDARTAMRYLIQNMKTPVIVFGESMGTGPAVQLATEYPLAGLVLQTPYTSLDERASENYWFFPGFSHTIHDHFDSLSKMPRIKAPVLILHGDNDHVISLTHGKKLFQAATVRKQLVVVPGAGHMDIPDAQVVNSMRDFFVVPRNESVVSLYGQSPRQP